MKKKAIIVDIDGTLADITHREKYVRKNPKDWKSFFNAMDKDTIAPWCKALIHAMEKDYQIILCSGRPGNYREPTEKWLNENGIENYLLFMRKAGDFRSDTVAKKEIYENYIKPHYDVLFVVDDRQKVVDMWREEGLTCLQCDKGDF